jgi:hypothetical protein
MKKAILTILISVGVLAATATIYPYLNVTMNSGSVTSYPTTDLTLKFENNKLVASNAGTQAGTNNLPDILNMVFGLSSEGPVSVAGDVNGDGEVTSADITALYNWLLNNDDSAIVNGDQNSDGAITSGDVTFVYNILLGSKAGEITDGDQTMWVVTGDVSWAFTTSQLEAMPYNNGTSFTAQGKTFNVADVDQIYVDNTPVPDNTVKVTYNGNTAKVIVAGNIAKNMTASVNGAHVVALQDANVAEEITYTLTGSSTNGSFYQDGEFKATVQLNGLTLNNPDSAAINIRDGKRIAVELVEGTTNNLTDGTGGSQKGCFAVKGHTEFKGAGILNITGNSSHAFWGKEYVEVKKTVGEINILGSKGDGFNINQYYLQNGGKVTIKNVADDGIQVSYETDDNDQIVEDEENTGEVTLKDGTLDMTMTSAGGKGIKAAASFIMLKGTLKMVQSGNLVAGDGDIDYGTCVKAGGDILIHGGNVDLTNTAQGGKGLNADGTITIDEASTTTTINIKANGQGGTAEAGSSSGGGETPQSYRIYVAKPSSSGGYPGGGSGGNAWTNMYLYKSDGTMVANITNNTVQKTSGYSTLTFYYYDFGSADSGTYYFKSDNYSSMGRSYVILTNNFSGPTSGSDIYYQIGGYTSSSAGGVYTRTYTLNNVTSTYGGTSDISEDTGTSYNAAGIKADGNITIDAGTFTIANNGSMSKSIKSKATVTINGGDITLTPSGAMQVINSDASYSSGIKAVDFVMNGGVLKINSSGVAGKGVSTTNITTNGGSITINNTGSAQSAASSDYYTAKGFKTDGNLNLLGGTIFIKMTGTGGKGIKVNGNYVQGVSGGEGPTLTVQTTGSSAGGSSGGGGWPGGGQTSGSGSAKAIKVLGTITLNGGQSEVTTATNGAEGIESKTSITVNGGNHYYKAYDDGMNCAGPIKFAGGVTVVYSNGNDAVDSNYGRAGAVEIGNGCVVAYTSAGGPEEGLDCDNNSYISITGTGYAISAGGSQGGGWGGSSGLGSAVQGYYLSTSSLSYSTGRYYTIANSSGTNLMTYSFEAGVSSSLSLFTAKGMTKGQSYTVKYSTTAPTNATTAWHGVYLGSTATGTTSFTSFTAQ